MTAQKQRRLTTVDERNVILAMRSTVTFPVASWDKRFFNNLLSMEDRTTGTVHFRITEKEAPQLWRLAVRYRRQWVGGILMNVKLLRMAQDLAAPDFRKQQAALNAQAKIDEMKRKYQEAMGELKKPC